MSKYKGLFTYDIDNHRYIPIEQADGIIGDTKYRPETKGMKDVYVSCFCKNGVMIEFETEEEAEKAVEKLKAWKRLKDRNLRFNSNYSTGGATINHKDVIMCRIEAYFDDKWEEENMKAEEDLDLLLGGEE